MTLHPAQYHQENERTLKFDRDWKAKYPDDTHTPSLHTFDSVMADFCYYSANCNETGYYPAFYEARNS